ncbi:MAG TPA: hypothetical protein VKS82_07285 [Streptosporangiaceae bacterium]|nr:hypothetical protein [Streptosporangiaceae bacterium]
MGIDTAVRRWCETCGRFTRSVMSYGEEICAEHDESDEEEW